MKQKPHSEGDRFLNSGKPAEFTVGDFWRWGLSDLVQPATLPLVAEFIVRRALGCEQALREGGQQPVLRTPQGARVRVASAAARPTQTGVKRWRVSFDIAPSDAEASPAQPGQAQPLRDADVFVFCLLENDSPSPADPLELSRWKFMVLPTQVLDRACPEQRTINRDNLEWLKPVACDFDGLSQAVDLAFEGQRASQAGGL
jgi:hypothetical protein